MKKLRGVLVSLAVTLGIVAQASAGETFVLGEIEIVEPWARASIGATRPSAAYFTIRNNGTESDSLIGVSNPNAKMSSIHNSTMADGAMIMVPVDSLEILSGQTITLKPGGLHVMLMKLGTPLKEGESTKLELTFEKAGKIEVPAPILSPGAREMN